MRRMQEVIDPREDSLEGVQASLHLQREIIHEIKNKLCPIMAYSRKLKDEEPGEEKRAMLDAIHRSAQMLKKFVALLSSPQGFKEFYQYHFEPADLKALLRSVVGEMEGWAQERGVHLHACLSAGRLSLEADVNQFSLALTNVIKNAIEASPRGGQVTLRASVEGAEKIRIEIQDEGAGIPRGLESRIFSAGFSTKPGTENSGIGLSVVKKIVAAHHGSIQALPSDKGARFCITIPLIQSAVTPTTPPVAAVAPGRESGRQMPEVLLVDDDPEMLRAMHHLLKSTCSVTCTQLGSEALKWMARKDFDRVVVDLGLADMTGEALYADLRQMSLRAADRVLFITGSKGERTIRDFLETTGRRCLYKPFDVETFVRAVLPSAA